MKKIWSIILVIAMITSLVPIESIQIKASENEEPYIISTGRIVSASSFKDANTCENAVDGSYSSRWESKWGEDEQWFCVDLGKKTQITGLKIYWMGAYAKEYKIQFSEDEENYEDAYTNAAGKGGTEDVPISGYARYIRIYMTKRALTAYGYSIKEFEVYGLNGITKRPVDYGENIALNKNVTTSGLHITDSMYDDEGNLNDSTVSEKNAVDGNATSKWVSTYDDNQWLAVDLGQEYEIGRIFINWTSDSGKIYDIQTSNDNENWTTLYRQLSGYASEQSNILMYSKARYVRIYGYTRANTSNGFCIYELQVYKYKDGDEKKTYNIPELPVLEKKNAPAGQGSYITSAMYLEKAKLPVYKSDEVEVPISTNDWWQSSLVQKFGNLMCLMPLKAKYSAKGLGVLTATSGWLPTPGETSLNFSVKSETTIDMYITPENLNGSEAYDRVSGNSDYSANIDLCDDTGLVMTSTYVKGCPYIFSKFNRDETVYISVPNLIKFFDDNGKEVLAEDGKITTDHIGVMVTDNDNKDKEYTSTSYYCLSFPKDTVIKNVAGKLKITFAGNDRYMSTGTMIKESDLNLYYNHGYAFVTGTKLQYEYNETTAKIQSTYTATTKLMRQGFSTATMQCLLPHQWKKSSASTTSINTYSSIRGNMKCIIGNSFRTTDQFNGIIPTFAMPSESDFDSNRVNEYLKTLESSTSKLSPSSDAYWEGKNVHPLAMGVLMADQIGNTELKDIFLQRLKKILVNWFNYDGEDDKSFFIYDEHWGTLYYKQSEFGANSSIADHHFTYGYFLFGASVLANYDNQFYNDYKSMVEMLIRDYGNYKDDDNMFCKFRNYDIYEGHSWAGGYANNDSGNNQESASEALFSWVGMYLWGIVSENNNYRDAGIYGFTNEIEAVEQYWFNYDKDNWIEDWPYQVVSQVYGGTNFFGTFFGGQPLYCYGIQWLPVSEYLTYYGMNQNRCKEIYQGLLDDTETAIEKSQLNAKNQGKTDEEIQAIRDNYSTPDKGWQHVTWSYLSMTNPVLALDKFDNNYNKVQKTDQANTYWYINSMKELGYKTDKVFATGKLAATVYYNESANQYTAMAWNPTDSKKEVYINNSAKKLGTITVAPHSLIKAKLPSTEGFSMNQVEAPTINVMGFDGSFYKEDISGDVTFDDNVLVDITNNEKGAIIYYTTDGSVPTTNSSVYTKPILVASNTVIKTYAVKTGSIDSSYKNINITINGTETTGTENVALGKNVIVSSTEGNTTPGSCITDGKDTTRWSSKFTDGEWCYIDLEEEQWVNKVIINWQNSYGEKYEILTSLDGVTWTKSADVSCSSSGKKETTFDAVKARYVKMNGVKRHTVYGYSIWQMEVYCGVEASNPQLGELVTENGINTVSITTSVRGALIYYTTDGSDPTTSSNIYTEPIVLNQNCTVKAITYREGMITSGVSEKSYIVPIIETTTQAPTTHEVTTSKNNEPTTSNKPKMPPGLIVKNPSDGTVTVVWGRVTGCQYNVYMDGVCIDPKTGCYVHTYKNVSKGIHTIMVKAINSEGIESDGNSKAIVVTNEVMNTLTAPNIFSNVNPSKIKKITISKKRNSKKAVVNLKKVKGSTGYVIKISLSKKFKKSIVKKTKKTKYSFKGLKKKRYYVKARAYIKKNGKYYYGSWSKTAKSK